MELSVLKHEVGCEQRDEQVSLSDRPARLQVQSSALVPLLDIVWHFQLCQRGHRGSAVVDADGLHMPAVSAYASCGVCVVKQCGTCNQMDICSVGRIRITTKT